MSSFLANLVARSAGVVEGVRPWLPSRFEPVAAGSGLTEAFEAPENDGGFRAAVPAAPAHQPDAIRAESVQPTEARSEKVRIDSTGAPLSAAAVRLTAAGIEPVATTAQPVA